MSVTQERRERKTKIGPCPFCGMVGKIEHFGWAKDAPISQVECSNSHCGALGPCKESDEDAINGWNNAGLGKYAEGYRAAILDAHADLDTTVESLSSVAQRILALSAKHETVQSENGAAHEQR